MLNDDLLILLILAAVAGFLLFRLRNVLGERTGFENPEEYARPVRESESEASGNGASNVVTMPNSPAVEDDSDIFSFTEIDTELGQTLKAMKAAEPGFDVRVFMDGARSAYEMLLMAYETGDKDTLRDYLADHVFALFAESIDARRAKDLSVDVRFVGIRAAEPVDAAYDAQTGVAKITVKYSAEIIMSARDGQGVVVEGDPSAVRRINDVWTYSRTLGVGDPNWTLIDTGG
ncbi:MAG: Tim44/TimA family putative adaptor protein [Rhodobacteraceae bacterium]|nr:Tim44/TimA family putative adaptor protein [Paracoccaceae bacterium]